MKHLFSAAALGLVALSLASTASAGGYKFKNIGGFTATGSITVTAAVLSLPCTAVLTGTTSDGAKISGATFSGLSCLALTPGTLPWKIHPNAAHAFVINSVTVQALVLGVCGPGNVQAGLNKAGVMSISGAGLPGLVPCSVSGSLKTSPTLQIEAKK
jgi:hypothetical protein